MDSIDQIFTHLNSSPQMRGVVETVGGFAFVSLVLYLESQRRTAQNAAENGTNRQPSVRKLLLYCAPELVGVGVVAAFAVMIRLRGDRTQYASEEEAAVWDRVKNEYPILLTADTLLSLQAMLRLVVAVSVVLRTGDDASGPAPLSNEPAALLCFATCARVAVVARTSAYLLDGPLGGLLPVACEVAAVPLLALLSSGAASKTLFSSCFAAGVALWFCCRNRLNLGEDEYGDTLFILVHTLELAAAFTYLARTLSIVSDCGQSSASAAQASFVHVILALQQAMPAYFFTVAFENTPQLVAAGHPFEILQYGNIAAFGAFLGSLALHTAITETEGCDSSIAGPAARAQPAAVAM